MKLLSPSALNPLSLTLLTLFGMCAASAAAPAAKSKYGSFAPLDPALAAAMTEVPDVPGLPRVLIIGDSISIGYMLPVRARLAGRATVQRPAENCGSTGYGLERLDAWLGSGKWAVIHFNFGLHDLKYLDAQGNYVTPDKGEQLVPIAEYDVKLREIVRRLQATGAKLIFATTTPIPSAASGRVEDSEVAYNEVAQRIMREAGVAVDDLHAFVKPRQATIQRPHDVHFTPAGCEELGATVAASIAAALPH